MRFGTPSPTRIIRRSENAAVAAAAALGAESLGTIVENSIVLAGLYERLRGQENLSIVSPFTSAALETVGGEAVLVGESGRRLQAGLLVGADGGNSAVRRLANISSAEWEYGQSALVTTVRDATLRAGRTVGGPLAWMSTRDEYGFFQAPTTTSLVRSGAQAVLQSADPCFGVASGEAPVQGEDPCP